MPRLFQIAQDLSRVNDRNGPYLTPGKTSYPVTEFAQKVRAYYYNSSGGIYSSPNNYFTYTNDDGSLMYNILQMNASNNNPFPYLPNTYSSGSNILWNCLSTDNSSTSSFASSNFTFFINTNF